MRKWIFSQWSLWSVNHRGSEESWSADLFYLTRAEMLGKYPTETGPLDTSDKTHSNATVNVDFYASIGKKAGKSFEVSWLEESWAAASPMEGGGGRGADLTHLLYHYCPLLWQKERLFCFAPCSWNAADPAPLLKTTALHELFIHFF